MRQFLLYFLVGLSAPTLFPTASSGQVAPAWAVRYDNGPMFADIAYALKVDGAGNVYVTGQGAQADGNGFDLVTLKYGPSGTFLWSAHYGTALGQEFPEAIALDANGNAYVVGRVYDSGTNDLLVLKIDPTGTGEWARRLPASGYNNANAVAIDGTGHVYVAGELTTENGSDYVLIKFDAAGNLIWSHTYSGPIGLRDTANALALDNAGNIYITGDSYIGSGLGWRAATLKYDPHGNLLWSTIYPRVVNYEKSTRAIAVDTAGNVYVGTTAATNAADFLVLKYDTSGALLWAATYDGGPGGFDNLRDLKVDSAGNVFVTGFSTGSADNDIVTVKFSMDGVRQWVSRYNAPANLGDFPVGLALDNLGNAFVGGYSFGVGSQSDYVALQYDAQGNQQWFARYDNAGNADSSFAMEIGPGPSIYLTGQTLGTSPSDYLTVKFIPVAASGRPQIITPPRDRSVIVGGGPTNVEFSVIATGPGPLFYQWRANGREIPGATSSTFFIPDVSTTHRGEYSVLVRNAAGETATPEARLTVHTIPSVPYIFPVVETVAEGRSVTFYVGAGGDPPLAYQWQRNGADIPWATNTFIELNLVSTNDAGDYQAIARNPYGEAISQEVRLNVVPRIPLDRWTWRHPVPHGSDLRAIVFGNGRFVAVGEGGAILSSADGTHWINSSLEVVDLRDIAFGNGKFVAISFRFAYTSTDGLQWEEHPLPAGSQSNPTHVLSIAFGHGVFVAVGAATIVSSNGVDWINSTNNVQSFLLDVTFGDGRFVAVTYTQSYVSTNGLDWIASSPANPLIENVVFGNGIFVGSYNNLVTTSTDGLQWSQHTILTNTFIYGLAFAGGQFLGFGMDIVTSPDGLNWTHRLNAPQAVFQDAASGNGVTVVIGDNANILTSNDPSSWNWISRATDGNLRGIAHGRNRFVVAGNQGNAWVSFDGIAWTRYPTPKTNDLRAVVFAQDRFVLVGEGGSLMSSEDGIQWESYVLLTNDLYGVSFVNDRFIAVGDRSAIVVSTNGRQWQVMLRPSNARLQGIAYGNGVYVVTGQNGNQARSYNATNWAPANYNVGYVESLLYTNGFFLGVGSRGISFSPDGTNWTIRLATSELEGILYIEGLYIVGGAGGGILTSTNGSHWIRRGSPATKSLRNLIYARGSVWAVGNNETILQSGQFRPYLTVGSGGPGIPITVRAEPGQTMYIERSTDLIEWYTLEARSVGPGDTFTWNDITPGPFNRVYRALAP